MNLKAKLLKKTTVSSYSSRNSSVYDDPMNKNFVYGEITIDFVNRIKLQKTDEIIADIGCGTGFAFDIMYDRIKKNNSKKVGAARPEGIYKLQSELAQRLLRLFWNYFFLTALDLSNSSSRAVLAMRKCHTKMLRR